MRSILVVLFWNAFALVGVTQQNATVGSADFASSLISAVIHNNQEIREFDVTFETEQMVMRADGTLSVHSIKARVASSNEKKSKMLFARVSELDVIDDSDEGVTTHDAKAFFIGPEDQLYQIGAYGRRTITYPNVFVRNARIGLPSFETVGFIMFPCFPPLLADMDSDWKSISIPNEDCKATVTQDGKGRVLQVHSKNQQVTGRTVWVFDLKKLVPLQRSMYYVKKASGKLALKEIEDYEWDSIGGVHVPISIRCEVKQNAIDDATGRTIEYSEIYTSKFKWRTINKEIPAELFDWQEISGPNDIKRLVMEDQE